MMYPIEWNIDVHLLETEINSLELQAHLFSKMGDRWMKTAREIYVFV